MHFDAESPGLRPVSENMALPASSSLIETVPAVNELPELEVVLLNADHVPSPATTPISPRTRAVTNSFHAVPRPRFSVSASAATIVTSLTLFYPPFRGQSGDIAPAPRLRRPS